MAATHPQATTPASSHDASSSWQPVATLLRSPNRLKAPRVQRLSETACVSRRHTNALASPPMTLCASKPKEESCGLPRADWRALVQVDEAPVGSLALRPLRRAHGLSTRVERNRGTRLSNVQGQKRLVARTQTSPGHQSDSTTAVGLQPISGRDPHDRVRT